MSGAPDLERSLQHYVRSVEVRWDDVEDRECYPFDLPIVRGVTSVELARGVTYFVGDNGSGKSTLLEAIAVALGFNPEGGSRNFDFASRETHSPLSEYLKLVKGGRPRDGYFLRAESFYNLASNLEDLDAIPPPCHEIPPLLNAYGGQSLHEQSHGESFWALFMHRFRGSGLYILDEPEAALSPTRQMAFLVRLKQLVDAGSQFLIATHTPIVLAFPGARIYELRDGRLQVTALEETETFSVTRDFLGDHRAALEVLMDDDEG